MLTLTNYIRKLDFDRNVLVLDTHRKNSCLLVIHIPNHFQAIGRRHRRNAF